MKNMLSAIIFIVFCLLFPSCSCQNVDCPEDGIPLIVRFQEEGSNEFIRIEDVKVSQVSDNNNSVEYLLVIDIFDSEAAGVRFYAKGGEKYTINLNSTSTHTIEIETLVVAEDECCMNYGINNIKVNEEAFPCFEECMDFELITIKI